MLEIHACSTAQQLFRNCLEYLDSNSGATSYHLQQFADAGLVVNEEVRGNKRDRWWRIVQESATTDFREMTDGG